MLEYTHVGFGGQINSIISECLADYSFSFGFPSYKYINIEESDFV